MSTSSQSKQTLAEGTLVLRDREYDFGGANPISDRTLSYGSYSGGSCLSLGTYINNRVCSAVTKNGTGTIFAQTNNTYDANGNLTTVSSLVSGSTYLTSSASHNSNGTLHTTTDPNGNITTLNYDGSCNSILSTSTKFPTVNGVTATTSQTWDCNGGVRTSSTDANGNPTTYSYVNPSTGVADPLWRLTKVTYPHGGITTTTYNTGATLPWSVSTSKPITSGNNLNNTAIYDGFGRVKQTQLTSDPDGVDYVDTTYDLLERTATVSNPHRSGSLPTDGVATYSYDVLNRVLSVLQPDGSQASTVYNNNCATATDEAGKARKSCVDGLGRLTGVWEDPSGLNYETDYGYDALSNLLSVTQKGSNPANARVRTFLYDGLSRLTSATNPESGATNYSYDGDGNLTSKQAPLPNQTGASTVTTTYVYDALSRLTKKSYSDSFTPTALFAYDNATITTGCPSDSPPGQTDLYPVGRRTSMCDASGGTTWIHDKMGRVQSERRSISGVHGDYDTDTFNLDGSIASLTALGYGIGYTYNNAGHEITVKNFADPNNYVTAATYAPFGALATATMGAKPITVTDSYNKRLQPLTWLASTTSATILSLTYNFGLGTNDNGNVLQITNNRDGNRTLNFMYDSLNRIQQAYTNGTNWGETFSRPQRPGGPTTRHRRVGI
jgi:YD repeat-containing protein